MKIGIIGCGWLGLPLAKHLVASGHLVTGSTTSQNKLPILAAKGIKPVLLKLDPMPVGEHFQKLLLADALIINIPPGRKKNPPHFYEEQIKYLKYMLANSPVEQVLFISSTSFYPNTNGTVSTHTAPDFARGSSLAVVQAEKQIQQIGQRLTILRCGGLMGDDRIPGKWFAGKHTTGRDTPVNYVHQQDVIRVVTAILNKSISYDPIMNLVSPEHPTRRQVHEAMARKYNFAPPVWEEPHTIPFKRVESNFSNFGLKSPLEF